MRRKIIIVYTIITLLIVLILSYYFLYNVYGVEVKKTPENLFADQSSTMQIEIVPVNAFGVKALFRSTSATFEIIEGEHLVEVISKDEQNGILKIRSLGKSGIVGIRVVSPYSLLPEYVEINIQPLTA